MWRTGEVLGYRWETITANNTVIKMAVYKNKKQIQPNSLLRLYILLKSTL